MLESESILLIVSVAVVEVVLMSVSRCRLCLGSCQGVFVLLPSKILVVRRPFLVEQIARSTNHAHPW